MSSRQHFSSIVAVSTRDEIETKMNDFGQNPAKKTLEIKFKPDVNVRDKKILCTLQNNLK